MDHKGSLGMYSQLRGEFAAATSSRKTICRKKLQCLVSFAKNHIRKSTTHQQQEELQNPDDIQPGNPRASPRDTPHTNPRGSPLDAVTAPPTPPVAELLKENDMLKRHNLALEQELSAHRLETTLTACSIDRQLRASLNAIKTAGTGNHVSSIDALFYKISRRLDTLQEELARRDDQLCGVHVKLQEEKGVSDELRKALEVRDSLSLTNQGKMTNMELRIAELEAAIKFLRLESSTSETRRSLQYVARDLASAIHLKASSQIDSQLALLMHLLDLPPPKNKENVVPPPPRVVKALSPMNR